MSGRCPTPPVPVPAPSQTSDAAEEGGGGGAADTEQRPPPEDATAAAAANGKAPHVHKPAGRCLSAKPAQSGEKNVQDHRAAHLLANTQVTPPVLVPHHV